MKRIMAPILVLLTILGFASYAFAASSSTLDGRPTAFNPGGSTGYFIWQDKEGFHLRTTTPGVKHVFSGTINTDGVFVDTFGKSAGIDDSFQVSGDRDKITFQFTNAGDTSGIDLHVKDGTYVTFNLSMDGDRIDLGNIFVGEDGWHPGSNKFTLRHDRDLAKYDDRTVIIVGGPYWWSYPGYWGPGYNGYWGPGYNGYWGPGWGPGYYGHGHRW